MILHRGKIKNQSKTTYKNRDVQFKNCDYSKLKYNGDGEGEGKDCSKVTRKLYILRNELAEDAYLQEVDCDVSSLRSRTSFILVDLTSGLSSRDILA